VPPKSSGPETRCCCCCSGRVVTSPPRTSLFADTPRPHRARCWWTLFSGAARCLFSCATGDPTRADTALADHDPAFVDACFEVLEAGGDRVSRPFVPRLWTADGDPFRPSLGGYAWRSGETSDWKLHCSSCPTLRDGRARLGHRRALRRVAGLAQGAEGGVRRPRGRGAANRVKLDRYLFGLPGPLFAGRPSPGGLGRALVRERSPVPSSSAWTLRKSSSTATLQGATHATDRVY
jgi:hypothetical protein